MIPTSPPVVNRITSYWPGDTPTPLPQTPAERNEFWTDAVFAAIQYYIGQLQNPSTAPAAAAAIFDLEKTRLRHNRTLTGTHEPHLEPLPPLEPVRVSTDDRNNAMTADDADEIELEIEDDQPDDCEPATVTDWPDVTVFARADTVLDGVRRGEPLTREGVEILTRAEARRSQAVPKSQSLPDGRSGLTPALPPTDSAVNQEGVTWLRSSRGSI